MLTLESLKRSLRLQQWLANKRIAPATKEPPKVVVRVAVVRDEETGEILGVDATTVEQPQ